MREDVVRDKKLINNAKVQFHRPLFIDKWNFLVHEGISDTQRVTCRKRGRGGFALEMKEGLVGKAENGEKTKCM
jgi:hypothetical protein